MNRAEKRRKERDRKKKAFYTSEEIEKLKQEARDEAFNTVFGCLFTLPLIILRTDYGFGKKRLQIFNDRLTDLLKEVERGQKDLNQIMEMLKNDYGIIFKNGDN